jgi:predicted DCC family thiol-disulfide oxidoreductase YuxK
MRDVTVLYDADCALCAALARPLASRPEVTLAPIRSERGAALLADLAPADRDGSLHAVDADGVRRSGVDALPDLVRRLRGGDALAWLIERFPLTAARGYAFVARNRLRLSRPLVAAQTLLSPAVHARRFGGRA